MVIRLVENNINDAYVNAAFESLSDNFSSNTENSSFKGILKTNKGIVDSIEATQKDSELAIGLNSLTFLTPKEIIDILQQAADNNDQYSNNDTQDGQIILYQDNNNITGTYAFAYDNTNDKNRIDNNDPIIKTINFNLAGIDITNSGEVINAIYHEGTNFKTHTNNEQEAHRIGSFAQDLWESNSIVNNYQNLNQITANQYNQIYNSSNNQDIAIGNTVSYVQHVYDNENVNNLSYTETVLDNEGKTIYNNFGPRWVNPKTGEYSKLYKEGYVKRPGSHKGTDIASIEGTPIVAPADGVVTRSYKSNTYGNTIIIQSETPEGLKVWPLNAHMKELSHLKVGDKVMEGQKIGLVGHTGETKDGKPYGNHSHFGINTGDQNGKFSFSEGWINPETINIGNYYYLKDTPAYKQGKSK